MKAIITKFKKGISTLLACTILAGSFTVMPCNVASVKAADDNSTEPSVTAYATKEELMNESFTPDSNGTVENISKLVFGKDSSGTPLEWYILGKDSGVNGENIAIFATSPITTGQVFENDNHNNKTFAESFGVYTSNPSEVYPNHYGASDLRVALQGLATNADYFTESEQSLMQATTVVTYDSLKDAEYITSDVLYAVKGDVDKLQIGSNEKILLLSTFESSGTVFWLRSPNVSFYNYVLMANTGDIVYTGEVYYYSAVNPASNLNLSSVIFASAATAESPDEVVTGIIPSGKAMTLRLDGSNTAIGNVVYDSVQGVLLVDKSSSATGTVALVVQGNDGTDDWYYSQIVDGLASVSATDIKTALNMSSDIDLSKCKIWLETTDANGMIYAVNASEKTTVTTVDITDIATPLANAALDTTAVCQSTGVSTTEPIITWTPSDATAGYNTSYTASVTLSPEQGYVFADNIIATVNGHITTVTKNNDGTLTVSYAFAATAKDKLVSITAPQSITVANGTAYEDMNLPTTVTIVTEGGTVTTASVEWNISTPASGSYDPAVLTEQMVMLNGAVACPNTIDDNGVPLTTSITITICEASIDKSPMVDPSSGESLVLYMGIIMFCSVLGMVGFRDKSKTV